MDWDAPASTLAAEDLTAELYPGGALRLRFRDPAEGLSGWWQFTFLTQRGIAVSLFSLGDQPAPSDDPTVDPGDGLPLEMTSWSGRVRVHSAVEEEGILTLHLEEQPWAEEDELFAIRVESRLTETGPGEEFFFRVTEDGLVEEASSRPDFSQMAPRFQYLQQETGEDRVYLYLYPDDTFLLTQRWAGTGETDELWGTWQDGNTAITLWADEQLCGPEGKFRLEKTGGLRIYNGDGPASLPLEVGAAFQKIGDLLDLPAFDSAVVSMVEDGDRPAIFLSREKHGELLDAFREMMADAAELRNPRWAEDPEDRDNIQFDLNLNGEDITMVLCPCIVAGTEDKYLLVQKDSWMGRVTYTYYQTQQGDDYDRMVELFNAQYEKEPQVLTAAMAAQTRALTAAISNLDWSEEYPLDENGIPIHYKAVLREQRATGYSSLSGSKRAFGAGSRTCQAKTGVYYCTAGTVAVRPEEIPYGSKLYIRTPGGGFIYGYAVANDTGTGLVDGVIDVDLFYDSYQESVLNSVRWVDIYILE